MRWQIIIRRSLAFLIILTIAAALLYTILIDKSKWKDWAAIFIVELAALSGTFSSIWNGLGKVPPQLQTQQPPLNATLSDTEYLNGRFREFEEEHRLERWFVPLPLSSLEHSIEVVVSSDGLPLEHLDRAVEAFQGRFVLIGEPGAGKSTLLRHRMKQAILDYQKDRDANRLPVWINLGVSENPIEADKLLDYWWRRCALESTPAERIENRNLCLFIDGLNEMPLDSREGRAKSLREFLERYPHLPIIVTCRIRDYLDDENLNLGLPIVEVHEMDDPHIQAFLHKRTAPPNLWNEIQSNDALKRWAANPLKLQLLIAVYDPNKPLPTHLDDLYGDYVAQAYNRFKEQPIKQGNVPLLQLDWAKLERGLKQLAYQMLAEGKGTAAEIEWARKHKIVWMGTNKLRRIDTNELRRTRRHKTKRRRKKITVWGGRDARQKVLLNGLNFVIERARRKTRQKVLLDGLNLGALVRDGDALRFYHQSLQGYFAIEPLSKALQVNNRLERFTKNPEALIRQIADLGEAGRLAVPSLLAALTDAEWYVRRAAAEALEQLGDARAIDPLLAAFHDADPFVRSAAASALGRLGDARAIDPLLAALHDLYPDVRVAAAYALGRLGDARAVGPLLTALQHSDNYVRRAAASALGRLGDARAVDPLLTALQDSDPFVRRLAAEALEQLGDVALEPLLAALHDADSDVRYAAAGALGQLGDARALDPLLAALHDADSDVRYAAAGALGQLGDARALDPLIAILTDPDWPVRRAAAEALGRHGDARALDPLLTTLTDADPFVRRAAAAALEQLGDARAVEPLIAALTDADPDVRRAAAAALEQLGDARAVEPLSATLTDVNLFVRLAADTALNKIRRPKQP